MKNLLIRYLTTAAVMQMAATSFAQSWSLVWREDFGVAEDTVIKNFADPTMTVPNHHFIEYEKVQTGWDNGAVYEYVKRPAGKEQCGQIDDGFYGIANSTAWSYNRFKNLCGGTGNYFTYGRDHTGNQNGAMLIINSGAGVGETIYGQDIDFDLCDAKKYRFKIFTSSVTSFTAQEAMLTLIVKNRVTGEVIAEIETEEIPLWEYAGTSPFAEHKWSEYYADFTANNGDKLSLQVINNSVSGVGNDFVIDDISLYRYDEDVNVPDMKIEESAIASATGGNNCSYEAQFSVVNSVLEAWQKIDNSVYVLWQKSEDGGLTWTNIPDQSGIDQSKLKMIVDGTETSVFRVIVTASPTDSEAQEQAEYIAKHNAPKNGCAFYSISNTISSIKPEPNCNFKETLRELWKEDFGVCDTFGYGTNSGMTLKAYTSGGKETMSQKGEYIVCSIPDSAIYHMSCDWDGSNCVKQNQFKPYVENNGDITPSDASYYRSSEIGNAFAYIRMNKTDNKANPVFYKKTISLPLCPCKTFMFNAAILCKGSSWGTNIVTKMSVYDKSGNALGSESIPFNYKGFGKKMASVPFAVPLGYSGDITVEMALDFVYNENNTSCADWPEFAIDDLSVTICGETMPKPVISIDGNDGLHLLSGFDCNDETPHKVVMSGMNDVLKEMPNAAFIWQSSIDGGLTWSNMSSTTSSINYEGEPEILYRVVIGESKTVAQEVASKGKPNDDCSAFYITNVVGFKCKEAGCRAPKFSLDADDEVVTLDTVFCDTPESVDIDLFQTNKVNVDDFYVATMGADKKYGDSKVMTPAPTSTDNIWTLSLDKKSAKYMIYAMNDTCKSDTIYINVEVREKLELKPVEDQMFCGTVKPEVDIELASGIAEEVLLKYGSHEGKAQVVMGKASVKFADIASKVGDVDVTAYAVDADGKCKSEEITFHMDYEDEPDFTFSAKDEKVCKSEKAVLELTINPTHNSDNHIYEIVGSDGKTVDVDDLVVFPTEKTTYTVTATSEVCSLNKSQEVTVDVELPQAIDLSTVPSPSLQSSVDGNIVCAPANVEFEVSGDNLTTWDWEYRKKGESDFSKWEAGSTSTSNSIEITEETSFRVSSAVASTNVCKAAYSEIITIEAEKKPQFTLALDKERVCETGDVELTLVTTETYDASQIKATANGDDITLTKNKYKSTINETTKFEVVVSGKVCAETKFDTTASVDHPLSFTLTPDKTKICEGEDVTFTVTGESEGIVWYKSTDDRNYSEFTPASGNKITPDETIYVYAGTPSDGACGAFKVEPVKIEVEKALSFDLVSDATGKICAGTEVSLSVKNLVGIPVSSKWEKNGIEITANTSYNDVPVSNSTYKLTLNGDVCPSVDHKVDIEVESADELNLTADKNLICEGESVTLTKDYGTNDPSAVTWWAEVDGKKSKISEITTVAPEKSTSYYLSVKGTVCAEVYSKPAIVDVEPKMDFELLSDVNELVCEGKEVTLALNLKSGRPDYVTFTANGTADSYDIIKNRTYKVKPTEATTYELTLKGTACAAETKNVKVDVQKQPKLNVVIDKIAICEGDDLIITPTAENVDDLVWESSIDGVKFSEILKSTNKQTLNPSETTLYSITTKSDDACEQVAWTQKVEVEPKFAVSFDDNTTVACPGEVVKVKATVEGMSDNLKFEWKKSVDDTNYSSIGHTSEPNVVETTLDTTTYFSLKVSGKYCEPQTATTKAIIDVVPSMTLEISSDSVCEGDEVVLSTKFTSDNFDESTIVYIKGLTLSNGQFPLSLTFGHGQQTVTFDAKDIKSITAEAETPAGCSISSDIIPLHIDKPISLDPPTDTTLCEGGKVTIDVDASKGYHYIWTIDDDTVSTNYRLTYQENESANVKLEASKGACSETFDVAINVVPTPHIVSVEESGANQFEFVAEGGTGIYQFDFGSGYQPSSVLSPAVYGRYYTISVKDEIGCSSDTTIKTPIYELEIPIGFTPDGDGMDDVWKVNNLDKYPNSTVRIYDRFGKVLSEAKASDMDGWDGTYNGKGLPSTDYWYEIVIDELDKTYTGHFTLIRGKK